MVGLAGRQSCRSKEWPMHPNPTSVPLSFIDHENNTYERSDNRRYIAASEVVAMREYGIEDGHAAEGPNEPPHASDQV